MPVKLTSPVAGTLLPIPGITLGYAEAGIRKANRKDVLLMHLAEGSRVSGVFTSNQFCAAPVTLCKQHLGTSAAPRAVLVNTGNANAGTGASGLLHARQSCEAVADLLGCLPDQVLPFSTGVILEPLPVDRLMAGLPQCVQSLAADHWGQAAEAIMTTDIVAKGTSRQLVLQGQRITVTGIAKGSGMIHPNMATMLGYIATDAKISQPALDAMIQHAVNRSFNCITVDGDTSTNDALLLIATGQAQMAELNLTNADFVAMQEAITEVAIWLAQAIVRDGEGATKFMAIEVMAGQTEAECKQVAYAIARSPLVKTAFFASDPNLGRILAAIGYAGVPALDVNRLQLYLGNPGAPLVLVAEGGGRAASYEEAQGQAVMRAEEIVVRVVLNRGEASATVWTCDFSYDYVKINADYRS